ncbi:Zinc/iron permease [Mycena floridula]|nr:Zinc/iron permease [Mycena floridula]
MFQLSFHAGAMILIFLISLFAVTFPAISNRNLAYFPIIMFIGKHFGTGVILSTGFCHLLDDAFSSLKSPEIKAQYPRVAKETGLIILQLHHRLYQRRRQTHHVVLQPATPSSPQGELTPLLPHSVHERRPPPISLNSQQHYLSSILTNSPRHARSSENFYIINDLKYHLTNGEYHLVEQGRSLCVSVCPPTSRSRDKFDLRGRSRSPETHADQHRNGGEDRPRIGRKRQVVGILVLQLGIMIHSLVIGLTLALTTGSDFTSLVTAIIFHQLFEGLSLGIRIAALPPSKEGT